MVAQHLPVQLRSYGCSNENNRRQCRHEQAISGVDLPCLACVTDLRAASIRSRYCRKRRLQVGNSNTFVHSPVVDHQTSAPWCLCRFQEYQGRWLIFSSWLLQSGLSLIVHAAWLQSLELRFPQVQEGILTRKVKAPRIVLGRQEHPARTELFPTKLTCRVRAKAAYVFGRHSMFWCFGSGGTEAPLQVKQIRGFRPHLKRFCSIISLAITGSKSGKDKMRSARTRF